MRKEEGETRRLSPALRITNFQIDGGVDMLEKLRSKVSRAGSSYEGQTIREDAVEEVCALQLNGLLSSYQKTFLHPGICKSDLFERYLVFDSAAVEPWQLSSDSNSGQVVSIDNWSCLNFSSLDLGRIQHFLDRLCLKIKMDFTSDPIILSSCTCTDSVETRWGMYKVFEKILEEGKWTLQLLIVILPDIRDFDVKLKHMCTEFPFAYALVTPDGATIANNVYLEYAACDIKTKIFDKLHSSSTERMLLLGKPFMDIFKAKIGIEPLKPPQQISALAERQVEEEKEEEEEEEGKERMEVEEEEHEGGLDETVGDARTANKLVQSPPLENELMWVTPHINISEANMGPSPLNPPQQISAKEEKDEKEDGEKEKMEVEEEEEKGGLDEMVGEDDDSDTFYLEELHSSIDQMEYFSLVDSEDDVYDPLGDDIFRDMDDYFFEGSDCSDKMSDNFNEEDDGQQAYDVDDTSGKPIEEEADIRRDDDVVQVENGIVRHWAVANFSYLNHEQSHRFLAKIVDICVAIGMEFTRSAVNEAQAAPTDIETTLVNVHQKTIDHITKCGRKEEQLGILLVILPDDGRYNDKVKEVCAKLKATFHCCYACESSSPSKGALKSIAYEIQSKVVMRDARLRRLALPLVSEAPILIFGADIFRDDNSHTIASVATSLDWPKFRRYQCMFAHDEGTMNVSAMLGSLISEFICSFCKTGKETLEKIILFRNGLKDGQFGDICHQEMTAIKKACGYIAGYELNITYVVVNPRASMGMGNKSGTSADLTGYKFFCCHTGGKNFSSLSNYHVVRDENNFPPGKLQALTSELCGIRDRRKYPEISMVPPAYYAKRGGMVALEEWGIARRRIISVDDVFKLHL